MYRPAHFGSAGSIRDSRTLKPPNRPRSSVTSSSDIRYPGTSRVIAAWAMRSWLRNCSGLCVRLTPARSRYWSSGSGRLWPFVTASSRVHSS